MTLIIGNKTYSSWSMRPWVLMTHFEIPFDEILVKLDLPTTTEEILKHSPSGKVPALKSEDCVIWDSLAIMEYLNEKFPDKKMYPSNPKHRAMARSYANEMHSGFAKLRQHFSFNAKKKVKTADFTPVGDDIARIKVLWTEALAMSKGPYLFGDFSIADAMYAPVVGRFETYSVPLDDNLQKYCHTILQNTAVKSWYEGARQEYFNAPLHD